MNRHTSARRHAGHTTLRRAGWLSVSSLVAAAAFAPGVSAGKPADSALASTVGPLAYGGGIALDGDRSEWTALDRYADMFRAGKADKQVESTLFLRYDCATGVLAVMVETVDGVTLDLGGDHFVKIDGDKLIGTPDVGNLTISGDGLGFEGSFAIPEGDYDLNAHAQVLDGGSQTSAVEDRSIPLSIECPAEEPSDEPSDEPSTAPSEAPSQAPSEQPSEAPSDEPSTEPSEEPSVEPSEAPSQAPSEAPSEEPSQQPSEAPSEAPSVEPSETPSEAPSQAPSDEPSDSPSEQPSTPPSASPTGGVEAATATPRVTPPATDALTTSNPVTSGGWRIALLGLAGLIAAALVLGSPRKAPVRR